MQPSAIDEKIAASLSFTGEHPTESEQLYSLALQVFHNLEFQHDWRSLQIHTASRADTSHSPPRPIVSGLPPHPVYIHPDRQIELIKAGIEEKDIPAQKEWVLPTHIREKWSLKKFAEVFDAIEEPLLNQGTGCPPDVPSFAEAKRILLATVNDDSTVVYYIVHDGIVKPRQN